MESDYTEPFVGLITTTCEKHQFMKILFRIFLKIAKPLKCLLAVLVSFDCYNILSQTHLLINPSEIHSLKILLTICLKPRAVLPPSFLASPCFCGCWHSLYYGHISVPFFHHLLLCLPNLPLPLI